MTRSLEDDFGDPDRSPRAGFLARIAHLFPYALALWVAYGVAHALDLIQSYGWIVALMVFLVLIVGDVHVGLGRICLRCMEAVPADAALRVARWLWLLWFFHKVMARPPRAWFISRYLIGYLLLVVGEVAVRLACGFEQGQAPWTSVPLHSWITVAIWSGWKHHRYQPWCPHCRWDGGGHREPSPDPDTNGVKTA